MEGWDLRALAVLERLNAAGHRAVLVGGCVRDRLMGRTPHDYDAATSARTGWSSRGIWGRIWPAGTSP